MIKKSAYILLLLTMLSLAPLSGQCTCAVDGGVCGDAPTWDPCCNPDRYYCKKDDEADNYGTCVLIEDKNDEEE